MRFLTFLIFVGIGFGALAQESIIPQKGKKESKKPTLSTDVSKPIEATPAKSEDTDVLDGRIISEELFTAYLKGFPEYSKSVALFDETKRTYLDSNDPEFTLVLREKIGLSDPALDEYIYKRKASLERKNKGENSVQVSETTK